MFINQWHFYTPIMHYQKEKLRKQSHLLLQQIKYKVPRYKFTQEDKKPILRNLLESEDRNLE